MNHRSSLSVESYKSQEQHYTSRFFSDTAPGALSSARMFLGFLLELYQPKSVLDVGCGMGGWLAAAEELGVGRLVGADGPWNNPANLLSKQIQFNTVNLETQFVSLGKFDLCISVEVAEHLSRDRADEFVRSLCAASDVVLFSAAIRFQGGVNHINEQWQSYWAQLFDAAGYDCHDLFRARFWNDNRVESWYRQNAFLYVRRNHPLGAIVRTKSTSGPLDIVHPEIYEGNLESCRRIFEEPSLKNCTQLAGRWLKRQLRKVF
jgi:SAM-dependent methyltransferase